MRWMLIAVLCLIGSLGARAEEKRHELRTTHDVRSHYDTISASWVRVPQNVLHAIAMATDVEFYDRSPLLSANTAYLARLLQSDDEVKRNKQHYRKIELRYLIGRALEHDEIITWIANIQYFGLGCYGASDAAKAYFGNSLEQLPLPQAAYLGALVRSPFGYHPDKHTEKYTEAALERRNFVLKRMFDAQMLSHERLENAMQTSLGVQKPLQPCKPLKESR